MSIRPERFSVQKPNATIETKCLSATLLETIYHDSFASVMYALKNGETVSVKIDTEDVHSLQIERLDVQLNVNDPHARAFATESIAPMANLESKPKEVS